MPKTWTYFPKMGSLGMSTVLIVEQVAPVSNRKDLGWEIPS